MFAVSGMATIDIRGITFQQVFLSTSGTGYGAVFDVKYGAYVKIESVKVSDVK